MKILSFPPLAAALGATASLSVSLIADPVVAVSPASHDTVVFRSGLTVSSSSGGRQRRDAAGTDEIDYLRSTGQLVFPKEGDAIKLPSGDERKWREINANTNGTFNREGFGAGYFAFAAVADQPGVMILEASGHSMVFVNGEAQPGDVYGYGYVKIPIALHTGTNEFFFASGRGGFSAKLTSPPSNLFFNMADTTLPDLFPGVVTDAWGAVILVNATTNWVSGVDMIAKLGSQTTRTTLPTIPPLATRKTGFQIKSKAIHSTSNAIPIELVAVPTGKSAKNALASTKTELRLRKQGEPYKRTFVSDIDGSVQYYGVNPQSSPNSPGERSALFLSLHGASVEGMGQASAYGPKHWGTIVSPTNRRPYGFDWEDWGRMDALEVLELATKEFRPDPSKIYLTGHSMGGHGTWNFGATFADRFAAIAPSAGWISFWTYGGSVDATNNEPMRLMLRRASSPSDTIGMSTNYTQLGVYVLHGDADDNVPVSEARTMRKHLAGFHHDFDWYEQPGAGHWWGNSDEPGTACVDWPPMFDFFARHRVPQTDNVRKVDFTTMNPGVSSHDRWLTIWSQEHSLLGSRVSIQRDPGRQRFIGTTENVARMALEIPHVKMDQPVVLDLDGEKLTNTAAAQLWLAKTDGHWVATTTPPPTEKSPARSGPFKEGFRHRMQFVVGTHGTAEENAWALAKARYDAEAFWYRGNGAIDIVTDTAFDARKEPDRGVVLYGHRQMNSAWEPLLGASPVQVDRDQVKVGDKRFQGSDLACLFVRPRPGSDTASVAVVSGTGLTGLRLTDKQPYFMAGLAYPDCYVVSAESLRTGTAGIRAAGFFGRDWSVEHGDFAWRE